MATPAETEIACRMNNYSLVYSRARFGQLTECVVFLKERVVVKLFLIRSIGLPEAEQGKVNGAFME